MKAGKIEYSSPSLNLNILYNERQKGVSYSIQFIWSSFYKIL